MWATEFGWATWEDYPSLGARRVDDLQLRRIDQSNYALRAFEIGQARADIELMFLWNLNYGL